MRNVEPAMMRKIAIALLGLGLLAAQPQEFEVASVKVSAGRTGPAGFMTVRTDPALVNYTNISLKNLIAIAYRFDSDLIHGGPDWLDHDMYDVSAKLPPGASKDQVPAMMQRLLADRFKVETHRESKEERVYFLTVAKDGPKLKPAEGTDSHGSMFKGRINASAMTTASLVGMLRHAAGFPVVDHTGITGAFDIDLHWTPEGATGDYPDLFTALQQQLGLRLDSGRAPVETLVVDRAERVPAEN